MCEVVEDLLADDDDLQAEEICRYWSGADRLRQTQTRAHLSFKI